MTKPDRVESKRRRTCTAAFSFSPLSAPQIYRGHSTQAIYALSLVPKPISASVSKNGRVYFYNKFLSDALFSNASKPNQSFHLSGVTSEKDTINFQLSSPEPNSIIDSPQKIKFIQYTTIPMVQPSLEQLATALKRAKRATLADTTNAKSKSEKAKSLEAKKVDTFMKQLSIPLTKYLNGFPNPNRMHPFEEAVVGIALGGDPKKYAKLMENIAQLRKKINTVGKEGAAAAANSKTVAEAEKRGRNVFEQLENIFRKEGQLVDELKEIGKTLHKLQVADPTLPSLVLVGAPNVGKSSIVRMLSSGKPEVCNYQFTTRGVIIGHFYVDLEKFQVMDTPGVLNRPDHMRNHMEKLTLATLQYLNCVVLFVVDLTEECGSSLYDQIAIRDNLYEKYGHDRMWIDVLSKSDLEVKPENRQFYQESVSNFLETSAETGQNIDTLKEKVIEILSKEKRENPYFPSS